MQIKSLKREKKKEMIFLISVSPWVENNELPFFVSSS